MTKVYSPSSTLTFQRCPQLWAWQRAGWQTKVIANNHCAMAVGLGIAHGMELIFKGMAVDEAAPLAALHASQSIQDRLDGGGSLLPSVEKTVDLVPKRVEKALRRFWKASPLPEDWCDYRAELTFPDHGQCRVDLLHNSHLGPCITDFKTKVTGQEYIIDQFMKDAETSWQMYHYVWAARQMGIAVESFAICLIVIEPYHIYLEQWLVDEKHLAQWEIDARRWWQLMELVDRQQVHPLRVGEHRDRYGLCEMYDMCHLYHNEITATLGYMKRERR